MKIVKKKKRNKPNNVNAFTEINGYDHYIGLDWDQKGYSLARLTRKKEKPKLKQGAPKIEELQQYLIELRGKKILTIEETTSTHWLYVELKEYVDKIVVCDPYRNRLLSEGAKDDRIDSSKLSMLLRGGLLKEVYHSNLEKAYKARKLVSSYEDLIKSIVRLKNQRNALYRAIGLKYKESKGNSEEAIVKQIEDSQNRLIELHEEEKAEYIKSFERLRKEIPIINMMCKVSGISTISSVKIYGIVIDAGRFKHKNKYWGYCGLANHEKWSGKKFYGKRKTRYSRVLKSVYKTAAVSAIGSNSDIRKYYEDQLAKGISEEKARNSVARYIAKVTYAIMKNGKPYQGYERKEEKMAA